MQKEFLLVSLLFLANNLQAIDSVDNPDTAGARVRSGSVAAGALIKTAGDRDSVMPRGPRPWNNTPAQDRARAVSCLKVLGVSAVVLTGAALMEYWRAQSICPADSLQN